MGRLRARPTPGVRNDDDHVDLGEGRTFKHARGKFEPCVVKTAFWRHNGLEAQHMS